MYLGVCLWLNCDLGIVGSCVVRYAKVWINDSWVEK